VPDFSVEQPSTEAGLEQLHDAVNQLSELVRDAARKSVALETRIEALPGPKDIAVAVEAELERTVREAREAIDARVGQLSGDLDTLERRLAEIGDALLPLEGLRTEIATVADESSSFSEIRAAITEAVGRIGSVAPSPSGPAVAPAVDTDELIAAVRGALDTTVASIRSDFEVLVRAEQQEAEKRIDALGLRITNLSFSVSKALEDLVGHSARVNERAQVLESENAAILEAVRKEIVAAVTAGEEARQRSESLGESVSARAAALESNLAERVAALESMLTERLQTLTGHVGALPDDITTTLAEINRTLATAGNLGGVQATIEAAAEQLRSDQARQLTEIGSQQERAVAELEAGQARALEQISERVAEVAPSVARALADVRDALASSTLRSSEELSGLKEAIASIIEAVGSAPQQTTSILDELRAPLTQMAEAAGSIEATRAELAAALASLEEHLVTRTAGVKTSITDRATRLETQISSLPKAEDVANAVGERISKSLTEAQRKADETADAVRHDVNEVASNVNEIWMRVRTMGKGLEELRAASKEDAATLIALIEEMAQSEERSAARLAEAERRFVASVRQIEHDRDRVFIETLNEFLERLPRRERNRLSKRMRALNFARRSKEEPEPLPEVEAAAEPLAPAAPVTTVEPEVISIEPPRVQAPKKRKPAKKPQPGVAAPKKTAGARPAKKRSAAPIRIVESKTTPETRKPRAKRARAEAESAPELGLELPAAPHAPPKASEAEKSPEQPS
jgi:hypothetical protein